MTVHPEPADRPCPGRHRDAAIPEPHAINGMQECRNGGRNRALRKSLPMNILGRPGPM